MGKPLKVLICSANLGNADPSDSFHLWIPEDGYTGKILEKPKYPLVEKLEDFDRVEHDSKEENANMEKAAQNGVGDSYGEQFTEIFDIIVIGMQESTWDASESESSESSDSSQDHQPGDASDSAQASSMNDSAHGSLHGAAKRAAKTVKNVAKIPGLAERAGKKGISTVNTLSISRDHTIQAQETLPDGTSIIHKLLSERLPSYQRILSFQRGEMRLLIYSSERIHKVELKRVRAQNTGKGGLANKGGIVGEIQVNATTKLAFMTCHLEAHEGIDEFKARCSNLGTILEGTKKFAIPPIYPDASLSSHFCFVLGDLNFRTRYSGFIKVKEQLADVNKLICDKNWKELNAADELRMALENQYCLVGFKTLHCNFPPTFKLERQEGYVYMDSRTPSYTDRILWRAGNSLDHRIKPLLYEPIDASATSDHKPIRAAFEIRLNSPLAFREKEVSPKSRLFSLTTAEKEEHLHLFVYNIQCDIFPESEGSSPSAYVCLVSSPEEILLWPPTKLEQFRYAAKKFLRVGKLCVNSDKAALDTAAQGWPRTPVMKHTLNPDWGNHEVHCILRRHQPNGLPLNLSGAILHLFVFKHRGRQTDEVIGSYPINLEMLYRSVAKSGAISPNQKRSIRGLSVSSVRLSNRNGTFSNPNEIESGDKYTGDDNIVSLEINGALMKNGNQTGVIRCTMEAWWINEAIGGGRRGSDGKPLNLEDELASMYDGSEDSQVLCTDRKRSEKPTNRKSN